MKIATWNVNSIRRRIEAVLAWSERHDVDVLCLQETKVGDDQFPREPFEAQGYHVAAFGEPQRNGVAILSRAEPTDLVRGLPGDGGAAQARWLEATVDGVRVASVYVPNGTAVGSDNFAYKLAFFGRLAVRLDAAVEAETPFVVAGDYNVAPEPIDVCDPAGWEGGICFHLDERRAWRRLVNRGFTDAVRALAPTARVYSFWEHRRRAFQTDEGVRIDHALLSPQAADRLREAVIDPTPRGERDASDHAPLSVVLA